jgi:DNA/RNA endonuclease YhcR with UshA esterase domain
VPLTDLCEKSFTCAVKKTLEKLPPSDYKRDMKRIPAITLVSLLANSFMFAQNQGTNEPPKIAIVRAKSADFFYNQTATVTGKVAQVTFRQKVVFLNLDEEYPKSPFTGIIFAADTNKFTDLMKLKGQNVGITGTVKQFENKPEIILTNANQLQVLEPEKK